VNAGILDCGQSASGAAMISQLSRILFIIAVGGRLFRVSSELSRDVQPSMVTEKFHSSALQPSTEAARSALAFLSSAAYLFFSPTMDEDRLEVAVEVFIIGLLSALVIAWNVAPLRRSSSKQTLVALRTFSSGSRSFLWQRIIRLWQRRRLLANKVERLERFIPSLCGSTQQPLSARVARASVPNSHNLHDWHEAAAARFLMPLEVAACRTDPEVCEHVQRLLADRWDIWDGDCLEPIPENDALFCDF